MERREVLDLATYEARVGQGVGARIVAKFPADVRLAEAVRLSRAMVALGGLPSVELVATAYGVGLAPAIVATLRENEWEAGPACTLERRVELDRIYQPDEFIGYTWRGSDARAGFPGDCTEEDVLRVANEARNAPHLVDEDDFESLADNHTELTLGYKAWTVLGYFESLADNHTELTLGYKVEGVDGEELVCESPEMALKCARVKSAEIGGAVGVFREGLLMVTIWGSGIEADFSEASDSEHVAEFKRLIDSGK